MTLNGHFALCFKMHAFSEPLRNVNEDRPILSAQRCRVVTVHVFAGNIRFMRIFAAVPWSLGVKRQLGNQKTSIFRVSDSTSSAL